MVTITETSVRFRCPNGHKIRAALRLEGREIKCPCCGVAAVVRAAPVPVPAPITDTGAFALLTECEADAIHAAMQPEPASSPANAVTKVSAPVARSKPRCCPRCNFPTQPNHTICPECRLLLESTRSVFKRMYAAAVRSLR